MEPFERHGIAGGAGRIGLLREPAQSRMQIIEGLGVVALAGLDAMHEAPKKVLDRVLIRQALVRGRLALPAAGASYRLACEAIPFPLARTPPEFAPEVAEELVPRNLSRRIVPRDRPRDSSQGTNPRETRPRGANPKRRVKSGWNHGGKAK